MLEICRGVYAQAAKKKPAGAPASSFLNRCSDWRLLADPNAAYAAIGTDYATGPAAPPVIDRAAVIGRRIVTARHKIVAPALRIVYQAHAFGARPTASKGILTP